MLKAFTNKKVSVFHKAETDKIGKAFQREQLFCEFIGFNG